MVKDTAHLMLSARFSIRFIEFSLSICLSVFPPNLNFLDKFSFRAVTLLSSAPVEFSCLFVYSFKVFETFFQGLSDLSIFEFHG